MAEVATSVGLPRRYGPAALDEGNPSLDRIFDCVRGINARNWLDEDMPVLDSIRIKVKLHFGQEVAWEPKGGVKDAHRKVPFIIECGDCPVGLNPHEHFKWARAQDHPYQRPPEDKVDSHWWFAIDVECKHSALAVDEFRRATLDKYGRLVVELELECVAWLDGVLGPLKIMMRNVHGPFICSHDGGY